MDYKFLKNPMRMVGIQMKKGELIKELMDILGAITRPETSSPYQYGTAMSALGLASRFFR